MEGKGQVGESHMVVPGRKVPAFTKIVMYETKARYIIVGSDRRRTVFRVLKIERTIPDELRVTEDTKEYSRGEIQALLHMLHLGNAATGGLKKKCTAYGIIGFVRFLGTYYILLVTRRARVGEIGGHYVYTVEGTVYLPILHPSYSRKEFRSEETRYQSLFDDMDTSKFWFSYSYDLTNTLQHNMTVGLQQNATASSPLSQTAPDRPRSEVDPHQWFAEYSPDDDARYVFESPGVRTRLDSQFNERVMWNHYLLDEFREQVDNQQWVVPLIHGYFCQVRVRVLSRSVLLALVARRSRYFAGTRFLKRGVTDRGAVGNDVETEQIVQNIDLGMLSTWRISSFVQVRGSIPLFWSQENSVTIPKPDILLQRMDPFYSATILHFRDLFARYGSPIVITNLIKTYEKVKRETKLGSEFQIALDFINSLLPRAHKIVVLGCDLHRANKMRDRPLERLASLSERVLAAVGFFYHGPTCQASKITSPPSSTTSANSAAAPPTSGTDDAFQETLNPGGVVWPMGRLQCGAARVNCIDSLDRTNAAQLALGKCALGKQLFEMGILNTPQLDYDSHICSILIELYDDMGNNLAIQYGGSELVNTIDSYRGGTWSQSSRDMLTTIRRYYSNAFTDTEKQHSINLFLGNYVAHDPLCAREGNIWDLESDVLLHNPPCIPRVLPPSDWWSVALNPWMHLAASAACVSAASEPSLAPRLRQRLFEEHYKVSRLTWFDRLSLKRDLLTISVQHTRALPSHIRSQHANSSAAGSAAGAHGGAAGPSAVPSTVGLGPGGLSSTPNTPEAHFAAGLQRWVVWSVVGGAPPTENWADSSVVSSSSRGLGRLRSHLASPVSPSASLADQALGAGRGRVLTDRVAETLYGVRLESFTEADEKPYAEHMAVTHFRDHESEMYYNRVLDQTYSVRRIFREHSDTRRAFRTDCSWRPYAHEWKNQSDKAVYESWTTMTERPDEFMCWHHK